MSIETHSISEIQSIQLKYKKIAIIVIVYNAFSGLASELVSQFTVLQPYGAYIFWLIGNVGIVLSVWYNVKIPNVPITPIEITPEIVKENSIALKDSAIDFQSWLAVKILGLKNKIAENKESIDNPEEYKQYLEESIKEALGLFDDSQIKTAEFVTKANEQWLEVFKNG